MKVKNIFLKGVLVFGIILLIWYCIRNLIINPIYNQILPWFLRNNDITASNLLERVCDLLSLLIAAIIMPLLLKGVDLYIVKKKERSSISVYSRREKNISGVKKKYLTINIYTVTYELTKKNIELFMLQLKTPEIAV